MACEESKPLHWVHALVQGRVQGVCFRYATVREATRLGLDGWVRNLRDGRVELVANGSKPALDELLAWCHQGPPHARVEQVNPSWGVGTPIRKGFQVRSDGSEPLDHGSWLEGKERT